MMSGRPRFPQSSEIRDVKLKFNQNLRRAIFFGCAGFATQKKCCQLGSVSSFRKNVFISEKLCYTKAIISFTLPETNIVPQSTPSQKETSSSNHQFSGTMLVSGREFDFLKNQDSDGDFSFQLHKNPTFQPLSREEMLIDEKPWAQSPQQEGGGLRFWTRTVTLMVDALQFLG